MKSAFDEMHTASQAVRPHYQVYGDWLQRQADEAMRSRRHEAEMIFRRVGITFAVYGAKDEDGAGTERLIPFDLIPRVIPKHEWTSMHAGLRQRVDVRRANRLVAVTPQVAVQVIGYDEEHIRLTGLVGPNRGECEQGQRDGREQPHGMNLRCGVTSHPTAPA